MTNYNRENPTNHVTIAPTPVTKTVYKLTCDICGEFWEDETEKLAQQSAEHHNRGFHND